MSQPTPSQTIGPFFHEGLKWAVCTGIPEDAVRVAGVVRDRDGKPANDAILEIWQPRWAAGPGGGLQRVFTGEDGGFEFFVPRPRATQVDADVMLFTRGLVCGVLTRVHLAPDGAQASTPSAVPPERRATLVATRLADDRYEWNIRLQGDDETVFFELT